VSNDDKVLQFHERLQALRSAGVRSKDIASAIGYGNPKSLSTVTTGMLVPGSDKMRRLNDLWTYLDGDPTPSKFAAAAKMLTSVGPQGHKGGCWDAAGNLMSAPRVSTPAPPPREPAPGRVDPTSTRGLIEEARGLLSRAEAKLHDAERQASPLLRSGIAAAAARVKQLHVDTALD
jgi:hypothetical protein